MARQLRHFIDLLDNLIVEEYHLEHSTFLCLPKLWCPPFPTGSVNPDILKDYELQPILAKCTYCGGDIFQSFFTCLKSSCEAMQDDDVDRRVVDICAACYVEGRACACGEMTPAQASSFDDILSWRHFAAQSLDSLDVGDIRPCGELTKEKVVFIWKLLVLLIANFHQTYN